MTLGKRSQRARLRAALLLALAVIGLCAPSAYAQSFPSSESALYAAAKKEGTVVWSVGGPLEAMNAIAAEFEKQYPGIKVQTLRLVGVQQYQRFLDETNAQRYFMDVLQNTDYPSMASLIKAGLISEWKIPTIKRVPDRFRISDYAYAEYVTTNAIIYNVNKVSPAEIKELETGWQAALDPRFKGRFAVSTMKCGVCYTPIHLFLDPKLKDKYGPAFLDKLAAQGPASYSEVLTSVDRVVAGEQDFTLWGWEGIGATKLQEGAPIRWVFPEPTPEFGNSWQGISAHAPHPNAARLFLNWTMSVNGAEVLERIYGSKTTVDGVPDQRSFVNSPWYHPPKQLYNIDEKRWEANYVHDMDLWATALKRAG
jgi:ABC-type Fe3+ transport system substrate-binding protein